MYAHPIHASVSRADWWRDHLRSRRLRPTHPIARILIADIQKATASYFGIALKDILGERRAIEIARPRQIAMYIAKKLTTRSLPEIGRKFGNRDHSTVIHAVRRIEELRVGNDEIDKAVRELTEFLTCV